MGYNCLVVHFQCTFIIPFLEAFVALIFPVVSCVLIIHRLLLGFLLLFLILFRPIIPWSSLIILVVMLLGLRLRMHETMIQKICELVEYVFLPQLTVLWARSAWLLVESEHGEGVEAKKHFMTDSRLILWYWMDLIIN